MSNGSPPSNFLTAHVDALKKHLPGGLLASYLALDGLFATITQTDARMGATWAAFAACFLAIPFWMYFVERTEKKMLIAFAMVSFVLLVFSSGGPLALTLTDPATINTVKIITAGAAMIFTLVVAPIVTAVVDR